MSELILKPGPVLIWREWVYDEAKEEGSWVDSNVTSFSHEYLFETITVDDGVLLADIFRLLDAVPILTSIFRRDFSEELLIEAQKGVSPSVTSGYSPEGIEYLELYQVWNLNTATHEYEPLHRLDFHGIGYLLREDLDEGNGCIFPAGTRIHWSISTTPLRELLEIPIRINHIISVCENDLSAKKYAQELEKVQVHGFNLSQILHGILWELSWHGGPEKQSEFVEELKSRVDDVKSGRPDAISNSDPFDATGTIKKA